ncbi:MAG: arsenate reductase family protein [Chlorobium sp.]
MATVLFFEKPGCINNTRQKVLLKCSGHTVESVNLLAYPWTTENLEPYLGAKPISECFNRAAPAIKSGEVDPLRFTREVAIAVMIQEPLLIKRPLMKIGDHHLQGFDRAALSKLISLEPLQGEGDGEKSSSMCDMNTCPHTKNTLRNKPE